MYTKDKSNRITLRLNENQFNFVKLNADELGVSPSEFLRMVINSAMSASMKLNRRDVLRRENEESDFDDFV